MACNKMVINVIMVLEPIDSDDSDDEFRKPRGKTRDWVKCQDKKATLTIMVKN